MIKLTALEQAQIEAQRATRRVSFMQRAKRLREILKPMNKRQRMLWTAKYRNGMYLFLEPKL